MHQLWLVEVKRYLMCLMIALVVGLMLEQVAWSLLIVSMSYLAYLIWQIRMLGAWLHRSSLNPPDYQWGWWGQVAAEVFGIRQRSIRRKKRLTRLLRRFQDTTKAIPDAVVAIDKEDHAVWFNNSAQATLGINQKEIGENIRTIIRHPDLPLLLKQVSDPSFQWDQQSILEINSPQDSEKTLEIRVLPYADEWRLILARDTTHIHRLMDMRKDFVANVSHELRTPLTVILGYLESVVDDQSMAADVREVIQRMQGSALRMKSIVEDLLTLSRLETDQPTDYEECAEVDIAHIVDTVIQSVSSIASEKHRFAVDVERDLLLKAEELEIYSLVNNLVTNAVRYSPAGGDISVRWYHDRGNAVLQVSDDGIGIAKEHVSRLTERFYRVEVGRSRNTGGTGLGLAIVKKILQRHDSELKIESELGEGSSFSCTFPHYRVAS